MASPMLSKCAAAYASVPFYPALLGHCIFMVGLFKGRYERNWLKAFWVSFIGSFGGGTMVSLLHGERIAWLENNNILLMYAAVWYALNYAPVVSLFSKMLAGLLPVRMAAKAASTMIRVKLLCMQVNLAVAGYPGQWYTPLFFGTVAATGGKFIADAVAALSGERVASSFSLPDWPVRSGFFGSLIYTFLAHWSRLLAPELAEAAVMSLFLAHAVSSDLLGGELDWTAPLEWIFHLVTRIPASKTDSILAEAGAPREGGGQTPSGKASPAPSATPSRLQAPSSSSPASSSKKSGGGLRKRQLPARK